MCTTDEQSDIAEIKRLTKQFEEGFNSHDLDKMMEFYADEYYDLNMRTPRQSKEERSQYYQSILDADLYTLKVNPEEIIITDDYGIARGNIILTLKKDTSTRELTYVELWKKSGHKWESIWGIDADIR